MFSRKWWRSALERASKSSAQALVLAAGSDATGWLTMDWKHILVAVVGMGVLSVATSIITTPAGPNDNDPSLV